MSIIYAVVVLVASIIEVWLANPFEFILEIPALVAGITVIIATVFGVTFASFLGDRKRSFRINAKERNHVII